VTRTLAEFERAWAGAFRHHLEHGDEESLHAAYELGRQALAEGCGVLDMTLLLWRAADQTRATEESDADAQRRARFEALLLESMSPFEMMSRGAREANEALRRLEDRREEETRRVAHELHDESAQLLAAVHLALDDLAQYLAPEGLGCLDRVEALLGAVEEDIRRIAYDLRPVVLDELGLLPALRSLAANVSRRAKLHVTVEGEIEARLPGAVENVLYRAAQEAVNNAVRHAQASHARIALRWAAQSVHLVVIDDGVGFDPGRIATSDRRRGLGFEGMRERLQPFDGVLDIRSKPGAGTEIRIRIPVEVQRARALAAR